VPISTEQLPKYLYSLHNWDAPDETGLKAAATLRENHPNARLFGIRIGYNVAVSFGSVMEPVYK